MSLLWLNVAQKSCEYQFCIAFGFNQSRIEPQSIVSIADIHSITDRHSAKFNKRSTLEVRKGDQCYRGNKCIINCNCLIISPSYFLPLGQETTKGLCYPQAANLSNVYLPANLSNVYHTWWRLHCSHFLLFLYITLKSNEAVI